MIRARARRAGRGETDLHSAGPERGNRLRIERRRFLDPATEQHRHVWHHGAQHPGVEVIEYGVEAQRADLANAAIINCLCMIENKIAGLAQVKPPKPDSDPHHFELSRFYVDAAYHGKGIAPVLMQETLNIMRARDARSLWLSVWQGSQQAIRFYQKQGFVISGETIFMIGDEPMNDWLMTKEL